MRSFLILLMLVGAALVGCQVRSPQQEILNACATYADVMERLIVYRPVMDEWTKAEIGGWVRVATPICTAPLPSPDATNLEAMDRVLEGLRDILAVEVLKDG